MPRILSLSLLLLAVAHGQAADDLVAPPATTAPPATVAPPAAATPPAATPPAATLPATGTPAATPPAAAKPVAKAAVKPVPARLPLPAPEVIDAAQKSVRETFKDDYAHTRSKPEDRLPLARKILDQALTMVGADTERLGMLREAAELAARAGDTAVALEAVDELAAHFAISLTEERLRILTIAVIKPATIEAALAAGEALCALADDGVVVDNYVFAQRAAKEADTFSRRLKDPGFAARTKMLVDRVKLLGDEYDKLGEITDLLGNTPPDAHQRFGRFLCFVKGDWPRGLPHLVDGDDAPLKTLAQADLAAGGDDADADAPGKVADGWYEIGQKQRAALKEEIQVHALAWYRRAVSAAQGITKLKLDKRIDELERVLAASGRHVRYPAGAALLLTFERETLAAQGTRLVQVRDTSGHNLHAVASGALAVESGPYGTALVLDGKSWLTIANTKELQISGSQTIAFWMRPDALGIRRNPFNKSYSGEGTMTLEINGSLNYFYGVGGADYTSIGLVDAGVLKKWTHVALVRDLATRRLAWFKDGKKALERPAQYAAATVSTSDLLIGSGYTNPFIGQLDDIGIWPRALTEAEIRQTYEAASTGR